MTKAVLNFAFEQLDLEAVSLLVLDINQRGIRCYEKSGFEVFKHLPDNHEVDGETFDDYVMLANNPNKER